MVRPGAAILLPFTLLLLLVPTASAGVLGDGLEIVAIDDYDEVAPVGTNVTFVWSLANVNATRTYDVRLSATTDPADYGVSLSPQNVSLPPGAIVSISANVSVPVNPSAPSARVQVVVESGGNQTVLQATVSAQGTTRLVDALGAFLAIGAIIFIGFFASLVFERTKVPDIVFLVVLGLILGPILVTFFDISLLPPSLIKAATPYFAPLALMIILFDGGLNLNFTQVVRRMGITLLHTGITFVGSVFVVAVVAMSFLGYPFWVGVLLGTVLGGTSGAVVIGVVRGMSVSEDTRTILILESTITDVLCIIGALTVIGILIGGGTLSGTIGGLLQKFLVALFVGMLAGILWLRVLSDMQGKPFGFMITIAALFILYAGVEILGGSGGFASLIFGLVLGNHKEIGRILRIKEQLHVDENFKRFHTELSFVVKTFFFVFLGFSFVFPFAAQWTVSSPLPVVSMLNDTFLLIMIAIALMFAGIYVVRIGASGLTARIHEESRQDSGAMRAMVGRGLAAAVLASFPFTITAFTNPVDPAYPFYHATMAPLEMHFTTVTFLIILLTVGATAVGVSLFERRPKPMGFTEAATTSLGERMQEETDQTRKELANKAREDERRRRKELREIEHRMRSKRKT